MVSLFVDSFVLSASGMSMTTVALVLFDTECVCLRSTSQTALYKVTWMVVHVVTPIGHIQRNSQDYLKSQVRKMKYVVMTCGTCL